MVGRSSSPSSPPAPSALLFDRLAHLPLVKQGALPAAIASIASGLVLENVVRLGFGNELRGYDRPIARDMRFGDIRVSPQQLETMAIAVAIMLLVFAALAFTRIGKAMRASPTIPSSAALKGIRPARVAVTASFVGMGLAGVGGMLLGLDSSIDPLDRHAHPPVGLRRRRAGRARLVPGAVLGRAADRHRRGAVGARRRLALPDGRRLLRHPAVLTLRPRGLLGERAF